MIEYICGPVLRAETSDQALKEVTPIYKLSKEIILADSVVCVPRGSVGIGLVSSGFLVTMLLFSSLGYFAGRASYLFPKLKKLVKKD